MFRLGLVLLISIYSITGSAVCFERYYSQDHLDKQKGKQEVRSVLVEYQGTYEEVIGDVKIEIHFVRNGKSYIAGAEGRCTGGTWLTGYCNLNDQGEKSASFEISNIGEYSQTKKDTKILFKVAKGFVYNDLSKKNNKKVLLFCL